MLPHVPFESINGTLKLGTVFDEDPHSNLVALPGSVLAGLILI
jgi:hypothetical protein